jgi:hypothetical protein
MRYFGVVYDVGLRFSGTEGFSVDPFDPALVRHDMQAIATDLHANAVRIEGEELGRLVLAGRAAHQAGLAVFFSPWKMDAGFEETRAYLAECATAAEQLRREGADVVFVSGCEYSIFSDGIVPGSGVYERSSWVHAQLSDVGWPNIPVGLPDAFDEVSRELNEVLGSLAETVRASFDGPLTYSATIFEDVDWGVFDVVGVNYYRETQTDEEYLAGLDYFRRYGKPIAIPEFGCCTYEGAAARGGRGWRILQGTASDGSGVFEGGVIPTRSEREQADCVERQLRLLAGADVFAAFVYVFAFPPYRAGAGAKDLDVASYSMVKFFPGENPRSGSMPPWEPKESFHRTGEFFRNYAAARAVTR